MTIARNPTFRRLSVLVLVSACLVGGIAASEVKSGPARAAGAAIAGGVLPQSAAANPTVPGSLAATSAAESRASAAATAARRAATLARITAAAKARSAAGTTAAAKSPAPVVPVAEVLSSGSSAPAIGTLATLPQYAAKESRAGVRVAMLEFHWADYEPQQGVFNTDYEAYMKGRLKALQNAGMRVTLAVGLHFAPAWVAAMPNSHLIDDTGRKSSEVDMVFNNRIRGVATTYLTRLSRTFPLSQFWAVRLTSGGRSEVLYPEGGTYWALGPNAQNGSDMPPSMARNPAPGWKPGTAGRSAATVSAWADWYIRALDNVVGWQQSTFASLGFRGFYQVLTPGVGVRPSGFSSLVSKNLPHSFLGVGAAWDRFYRMLANKTNVVAYVSSMADGSGGNSGCALADRSVGLSSGTTSNWSAVRWVSRVADEYGLRKSGENPGYSASPEYSANYRNLSSTGMAAVTFRQASTCGFQVVYWAHDEQLWNGTVSIAGVLSYANTSAGLPALAR